MGDVVGSIASKAIEVLLQNLISLCAEEISHIRNFKKDLEKLKKSLIMIQAFLDDAEKQQVTNKAVKTWLKNLEGVAFQADNVLDELSYEVLCKKAETGNKLKKKVQGLFSFSTRTMALKIKEINQNLELINQEAMNYGFQTQLHEHAPRVGTNRLVERETDSYSESIVVGREDYVSKIVEMLTSNFSPTHDKKEDFNVLPIVGMGGLGKTTIAKLVFNDEKIKTHFDKLIWVYVSENFDAKDLFKKILESSSGQKVDLETKDALLRKLQEIFEAKKCLLVLDDIWTEETKKWDDFLDTLSNTSSIKGNGIIVTTRSEKVASIVGTIRIPELSKLPDEDCLSIIKEKAFRKGYITPSEFEPVGKKIAQRCQGLPLAAKVVGGMLRGKSKDEWHSIEETRLSNLGEEGDSMMKILKLSFDNLPTHSLKKCFAFCSIFPKGFDIERKMLIYLWMAEGFLQSDQGNNMESVGEEYFNFLLQASLLQTPGLDYDDNIIDCKMHDLVHDLACSVLHETGPVRYVYMKSVRDIQKDEARNLRSLIFEGKFSENMFSDLKYLRGLVLIGYDNKELPKMEHLIHLRYLDISASRIEYLAKSIGNLYHLQTLRVNTSLKEMPKVSMKLMNLRHLHIFNPRFIQDKHESNIEEIPMLGHLPHLKSLYLGNIPDVRSIGSSLDGIHDNGIDKETIIVFPALERLELSSMLSMTELLTAGETQLNRETVMFPHLEYLSLIDCPNLTSAPSHFPCLKELEIFRMDTSLLLENLLANLTSLATLRIYSIEGLVCFPDVFFANNQNLSYLRIGSCQNLTHLSSSFGASLRKVVIFCCENLQELPTNLHCLNSLEELQISSCPNLKSIPDNPIGEGHGSVQGFTSLRELNISWCDRLTDLPSGMIELCTSLENVNLFQLPNVTNLATVIGCLQNMPHLTTLELDFRHIPKLDDNNFPIEIGSFRSLLNLTISCGMENWDHVQDQLQHLTTLRYLRLRYLEIKEVPEWLGKLSSLEVLILFDFPNLTSLPSKEAMKRLTTVRIARCPLLNLQSDDDDSEWHKISHIANVRVS